MATPEAVIADLEQRLVLSITAHQRAVMRLGALEAERDAALLLAKGHEDEARALKARVLVLEARLAPLPLWRRLLGWVRG